MAIWRDGMRKRGKYWYGRYYAEDGTRPEIKLSVDKAESKRMLRELNLKRDRVKVGVDQVAPREVLLSDLLDEYMVYLRMHTSSRYAGSCLSDLGDMFRRTRARRVGDLTSQKLETARNSIVGEGRSHRTANRKAGALVAMLNWAVKTERLQDTPLKRYSPLPTKGRHQRKVRRRLSSEELETILDAATGDPSEMLFLLVAGTGIRLGEAIGATFGEIDGNALRLPASRTKNSTARRVVMPAWLVERAAQERSARAAKGHHPIAVNRRGSKWARHGARTAFVRVIEKSGLPRVFPDGSSLDWHALRHTYATMMASVGASTFTLQQQLGWKHPNMAQVYVDQARSPVDEAVGDMEQGLWAARDAKVRVQYGCKNTQTPDSETDNV